MDIEIKVGNITLVIESISTTQEGRIVDINGGYLVVQENISGNETKIFVRAR